MPRSLTILRMPPVTKPQPRKIRAEKGEFMDPKLAQAIGLIRHQIISPVLLENGVAQMEYFKHAAQKEYDIPGRGPRRFTATTLKAWLYRYKRNGFPGITPKTRCDQGGFRKIQEETKQAIQKLREEHLDESCVKFYERCLKTNIFGERPICIETLRRFLRSKNLYRKRAVQPRKRFEMSYFGELWTCDFMHGPQVLELAGGKNAKRRFLWPSSTITRATL
jgi:putative transposase